MVALAVDLAERQLRDGTATSQVISHYLKLGSSRERLEQERLNKENELMRAKIEALASAARVEELYTTALNAMRSYAGQEPMYEESLYEG
jgi:cell division protein FtsL